MYSQADLDHLRALKQAEPFTGFRERTAAGEDCKLQILGRGEVAFYQRGDRALLFELLAGHGVVFADSIRRWDDGKKVTEAEREAVVAMATRALQQLGAAAVEVVRK